MFPLLDIRDYTSCHCKFKMLISGLDCSVWIITLPNLSGQTESCSKIRITPTGVNASHESSCHNGIVKRTVVSQVMEVHLRLLSDLRTAIFLSSSKGCVGMQRALQMKKNTFDSLLDWLNSVYCV